VLDIISAYGRDAEFAPHPYGHAVHSVARALIANPDTAVEFVIGADDICAPCTHLQADEQCDDILAQLDPPLSKQSYNDALDTRLFEALALPRGESMSFRAYLALVSRHLPGLADICSHPGEDPAKRLAGLRRGLEKLGVDTRPRQ
jgi:hypothetical protein